MRICVRMGHQSTGNDQAAVGIIREFDVNRAYAPYVISGLQRLGHEVLDVTPPEANRTLGDSLMYGINKANDWGADYFISCHANDVDIVSVHGCEVIFGSAAGSVTAQRIVNELNNLGFSTHRGAYLDERGLAEIHKTNMPCNIIEPLFISSQTDVDLYNKIGPEKLGYAIVKGITGQDVIPVQTTQGGKKVKNLCVYSTEIDKRAAEYLADYLQCPIISNSTPFDFSTVENTYAVGTGQFTSYAKVIAGSDRYETLKAVLKFMGKI